MRIHVGAIGAELKDPGRVAYWSWRQGDKWCLATFVIRIPFQPDNARFHPIVIPDPILSIDHLVLTVSDIQAACDFYRRVLRAEVLEFSGGRRAIRCGRQKINLQLLGQETRNRAAVGSGDICLLSAWSIDEIVGHLECEGVRILEGPVRKEGATGPIMSVYFNDPDSNLIELSVCATGD